MTIVEAAILVAPVWCVLSALTVGVLWAVRQLHIRYRWWRVRRDTTVIANAHRVRERELQAAISVSEWRH